MTTSWAKSANAVHKVKVTAKNKVVNEDAFDAQALFVKTVIDRTETQYRKDISQAVNETIKSKESGTNRQTEEEDGGEVIHEERPQTSSKHQLNNRNSDREADFRIQEHQPKHRPIMTF